MSFEVIIAKIKTAYYTGFFHIFGMNILNKILSFVSTAVLVRILTKAEYGIFTYSWNIYSFVLLFNGFGIASAILQLSSEHGGDEKYTQKISTYGSWLGIEFDILLVIVIIGIALFAPLKIEGSRILLLLLSLLPIVQLLYDLCQVVLRAQKRNREFAKLCLISTIFIFVVSVGGAVLFREIGMVVGYYTSYFLSTLYARFVLKVRLLGSQEALEKTEKKILLSIATVAMANNAISQLLYLLDVFVLGMVTAEETLLAGYKVATIIPTALVFVPMSFVTYIYPYFAEHRTDKKWCLHRYKQVLVVIGTINLTISLILLIFTKYIIILCFGSDYLDIVPIFRILAVNYFFSGTFRIVAGNLLVTQRKLKFNLFVAILCGIINIFADYIFITWWGSIGAAYATILVVICSSVLNVAYLLYTFTHIKNEEGK